VRKARQCQMEAHAIFQQNRQLLNFRERYQNSAILPANKQTVAVKRQYVANKTCRSRKVSSGEYKIKVEWQIAVR